MSVVAKYSISTAGCSINDVMDNLREQVEKHETRHIEAASVGLIQAIIRTADTYSHNANIQAKGCQCLGSLAQNGDNQKMIATAGGIDMIVRALRQHPSNPVVQYSGCSALENIALHHENSHLIYARGGVSAILTAMQKHPSDTSIQQAGCCALRNLATMDKSLQETIVSLGGIATVLVAMRQHPENADLQLCAVPIWALWPSRAITAAQ